MDINEALVGKSVKITATYTGTLESASSAYVVLSSDHQLDSWLRRDHITDVELVITPQPGDIVQDKHGIVYVYLAGRYRAFTGTFREHVDVVSIVSTAADREAARLSAPPLQTARKLAEHYGRT